MKRVLVTGLAVLALAGCGGGRKVVPVSGVVTVDGQPARNVVVSFQPLGSPDEPDPGRGSSGTTDENGRYTLVYDGERPGALTGKHRVRIWPQFEGASEERAEGEPPAPGGKGAGGRLHLSATIPIEWNEMSTREFDVPPGGTDKADFHIENKAAKK